MKIALFLFLCSFASFCLARADTSDCKEAQIAAIDTQIKALQDAKDRAAMRAYVEEDQADDTMDRDFLSYRTDENQEALSQDKAQEIESKIAALQKQKRELTASP